MTWNKFEAEVPQTRHKIFVSASRFNVEWNEVFFFLFVNLFSYATKGMRIGLDWIEWVVRHKNALIQSHCPYQPHHFAFATIKKNVIQCSTRRIPWSFCSALKKISYDWKISKVNRSISHSIQFNSIPSPDFSSHKKRSPRVLHRSAKFECFFLVPILR